MYIYASQMEWFSSLQINLFRWLITTEEMTQMHMVTSFGCSADGCQKRFVVVLQEIAVDISNRWSGWYQSCYCVDSPGISDVRTCS